ncbi:zinc finger chc2-type [Lucifera butyrica]|uniref:Zinc finger chc2-type n=1 Tax=Lucifera butyrica TaxID=1351585 RepID=A0A498R6D8_9FIRM|nr:CHC2 zinc finger domain-containing protein [Lucifera butyrica]VBB06427.1 zinc finger chc2-type [Lucifera butyrica]
MTLFIVPGKVEIEQLKSIPIVDIWNKYGGGDLKRRGKEWAGRCTRHGNDSNPSLMLNPEKNNFYCHGCKEGGDGIKLGCWLLNCDFKKTITQLTADFNITLPASKTAKKEIAATYDYQDADGNLIYQAVRMIPKDFRQRQPDGKGGGIWNLIGITRLPYKLPELLAAIGREDMIYIVEGEKDANNLNTLGFATTCNSEGAGKWTEAHSKYFPAGTEVAILPDHDKPGRQHATAVANQLTAQGCLVKVAELPGLAKLRTKKGTGSENGADISDWLKAGHDKDELVQLVSNTEYWEPAEEEAELDPEQDLGALLDGLETSPEKDRLKYFKKMVLPMLADTDPVERAQASKRVAKALDVSMQVINQEIRQWTGESRDEKSQADILTEIALSNVLFHDDLKEPYTLVEFEDHNCIIKIGQGKDYVRYIAGEYYRQIGNSPCNEAIRQAVNVAEAKAIFEGPEYKLELRVTSHDGAFWYDLGDERNRAIQITPGGWQVIDRPPILFRRRNNQAAQIEPQQGAGNVWRLADFVNLDESSLKLLLVYLVTSLVPGIPHVIPVFHGEKGAAKSTTMQFIRRILDPAKRELFALPRDQNELALHLYGNYMPCYDNLSGLSQMQSDMLCGAATGGGISKRTLYSNDEDTILKFFCCPVLNGINVVANATDLLDRCLIFELQRIAEEDRREVTAVFREFEAARPIIFAGLLDTLSAAMQLYPTIQLKRLPRMADFAKWGYVIAEVLGIGGETFMSLYRQNMDRINATAIDENVVASAIVALMSEQTELDCTMAELLDKLNEVAEEVRIDTKSRYWPKQPNALSNQITQIKSNLLDVGIECNKYRMSGNKGGIRRVNLVKIENPSLPSSRRHEYSNDAGSSSDDPFEGFTKYESDMPGAKKLLNFRGSRSAD